MGKRPLPRNEGD